MNKITVIGAGHVGSSVCSSLLNQGLAEEIALIDLNKDLVTGEVMDLSDAAYILDSNRSIKEGTYDDILDSEAIIITAGLSQSIGVSKGRMAGLSSCLKIMTSIASQIKERNYQGFIIVASNPLDVMSYYAYKLSVLNSNQVIGTGTLLDSARAELVLAKELNVLPHEVQTMILGEHGSHQFIASSLTTVKGEPLLSYLEDKKINEVKDFIDGIEKQVSRYGYSIIEKKGATYYGVANSVARIIKAIQNDEKIVLPVSVYVDDVYGVKDTYLSIPCIIGKNGIEGIKEVRLSFDEQEKLIEASAYLHSCIDIKVG